MKRFLSILLTFVLTVSCFVSSVFADTNNSVNKDTETTQTVAEKEDTVSEAVVEKGLYEKEKVQEFNSFEEGSMAVHEIIENNSKKNQNNMENELFVDNCVIVGTEQDISFDTNNVVTAVRYDDMYYIQYNTVQDAQDAISVFQTYPTVEYVEADSKIVLDDQLVLNVDSFTSQDVNGYKHYSWGVTQMGLDVFADYVSKFADESITIAVVDSGVYDEHPFLQGKILSTGKDYINNDNDPDDDNGHGTHVAGIIVDCMQGLDVDILPVKVLNSNGEGTYTEVASGIRYAADSGADVINLSLGGSDSSVIDDAIDYAISKGATIVASSGNGYINTVNYCPAHRNDIIVTAAIDSAFNNMYGFTDDGELIGSNYGTSVDITAPGVVVQSCVPYTVSASGFAYYTGTSMAAPHITASVAMLKMLYPTASFKEIENMLKSCAQDLGTSGYDTTFGAGMPVLKKFITDLPFYDVLISDWYYDSIFELYTRGYMTGKNSQHFDPAGSMKRQDVAVLFYRMAGTPAVAYRDIYDDVTSDSYYANASVWAYDNGIMTGWQNGYLGVNTDITRQDFAIVLYRYADKLGLNVSDTADISGYTDAAYVSAYAQTAVSWAVGAGLMGQEVTALNPLANASRADIAVMIYRFIQKYNL